MCHALRISLLLVALALSSASLLAACNATYTPPENNTETEALPMSGL